MEWQKAKKFVVVLLVILNACLAVLNYQQNRESAMTASQEKAIFEVLSKNGITMYTDLITETEPMSRLECMVPTYTKEDLERAFFDGEKTTVVPSQTTTVYRTSSSELTVEGAHGTLTFPQVAKEKGELSRGDALKMAEEYMGNLFPMTFWKQRKATVWCSMRSMMIPSYFPITSGCLYLRQAFIRCSLFIALWWDITARKRIFSMPMKHCSHLCGNCGKTSRKGL